MVEFQSPIRSPIKRSQKENSSQGPAQASTSLGPTLKLSERLDQFKILTAFFDPANIDLITYIYSGDQFAAFRRFIDSYSDFYPSMGQWLDGFIDYYQVAQLASGGFFDELMVRLFESLNVESRKEESKTGWGSALLGRR